MMVEMKTTVDSLIEHADEFIDAIELAKEIPDAAMWFVIGSLCVKHPDDVRESLEQWQALQQGDTDGGADDD